jgi:metal-dependent amidase/aminoacylase/carboxypeptidase family protein
MSDDRMDAQIRSAVAAREPLIRGTIDFIHAHPELAHAEVACAGHLGEVLGRLGLTVEPGVAGMATAFRATLQGGLPGRTVGLVAIYDAVQAVRGPGSYEPTHSCGHGPISGGVVGAVAALAMLREQLPGSVVVMGCPADEIHAPGTIARGGGKALSAAAGAWDGIDAALYAHPEFLDTAWAESAWMRRDTALVTGARTMVNGAPQAVLASVAAAVAAASSFPATQVMLETLELDGDVEEGTGMVARARFLMWAPTEAGIDELATRLRAAVPAEWERGVPVPGIAPDQAVRDAVREAHQAAGNEYVEPPMPLPFATDFGAVTRRVPAALVGLGRPGGWAFHLPEGATQFASEDGVAAAIRVAEVLALAAHRLVQPR